ncbi:MAG: hypothetical protein H0X16_06975 [Chloroflexi bacterium]|nr:hypothetical protein [Chloroflexota bacterium]
MYRTQHAPRARTIIVALVLILVGMAGTFGEILPDNIGIYAFVAATLLLLIGVFFERI